MTNIPRSDYRPELLEKLQVEAEVSLSPLHFVANHLTLEAELERETGRLALRLKSFVLAREDGRVDVEERWPADWWQAFRERWFPKWWLQRYPIRYRYVSVHEVIWRVCPHADIRTNDIDRHIAFLVRPAGFNDGKDMFGLGRRE